jgi:hypothetical protein
MGAESCQLDDVHNRPPEPIRIEADSNATRSSVDEIVPVLNVNSFAYRYGKPIKLVNGTPLRNTEQRDRRGVKPV